MARAYDVTAVERKWQEHWHKEGTYEVENDDPREKFYALCMYPYPSGAAHQGHVRNYTLGDLVVRYQTMLGKAVLSPIGFDSFGLPAENAAIKTGTHPRVFTDARIAELTSSLRRLGAVYDWRREVHSHDPEYIKWNQVIFLKFWEAGLAYRAKAPVNWCPGCQTVLANEQVLADGTCDRSGDVVERRDLEQWFLRITHYADELLEALDALEWPERAKIMQRNWIGRSEGAEFDLAVEGRPDLSVRVFTTRPDTSFGMTYAVMAPEHPQVDELTSDVQRAAVEELRRRAAAESDIERMAEGDAAGLGKRGAFTGSNVINPFTGDPVPLYVADYVLMGYGTGAIMAVPAEDQRDWDFATVHGLPIVRTVQPPEGWDEQGGGAFTGEGPKINSDFLDGLDIPTAKARAIDWLEERGDRRAQGELPIARLAGVAAALLGLPDPRCVLRRARGGACARGPAARGGPRRRRVPAHRAVPARPPRGLLAHDLPGVRRTGAARDGHHGHLRGLVVVLPALLRPLEPRPAVRPGCGTPLHAGRPVHRRHRARHLAPALRPLLHPRPHRRGSGPGARERAVPALPGPGHDPHGRHQDVQVKGQPDRAGELLRHRGSRRAAPLPPLRRAALRRHGLVGSDRSGHRRLWAVPRPPLAYLHDGDGADGSESRVPRTSPCARPCTAPSPKSPRTWSVGPTTRP